MSEAEILELDEIIAKAVPFKATDCHREKEIKRYRRQITRKRLLELYDRIRAI